MVTDSQAQLAIVVPAFKARYLAETLESIAGQSDQRFNLYVFDDASPEDVACVCRDSLGDFPYIYRRFDTNMGGCDLPAHWNRCIEATREPWVWLFADDDLMSIECVAAFLREVEETRGAFSVYAFGSDIVDPETKILLRSPDLPQIESGAGFALNKLEGKRISYIADHAFARTAFEHAGGFRSFPLGWCSDDAAWVEFSREQGIRKVSAGRVAWRSSEVNISEIRGPKARPKLDAALAYVEWLRLRVAQTDGLPADFEGRLMRSSSWWLVGMVRWQGISLTVSEAFQLVGATAAAVGCGRARAIVLVLGMLFTPLPWRMLQYIRRQPWRAIDPAPSAAWSWQDRYGNERSVPTER